jgi:uncharacterized protein YbaR (Trm112 family)
MFDKELLDIIVCPVSHQPLQLADQALLARINQAIGAGWVKDQLGRTVAEPLEEALIRKDGRILYPIRDGIPVMLGEEGISVQAEWHEK